MDRRRFLSGMATPVLLSGLPSCSPSLPALPKGAKIAIIGAGLSGLACANSLFGRGYKVSILEGRKRPGGRVETSTHSLFRGVELGASYLHGGTENPLRQLCHKWNIPLRTYHHTNIDLISSSLRRDLNNHKYEWETFDIELDDEALFDVLKMLARKTLRIPLRTVTMGETLKRYFSNTSSPFLQDELIQKYIMDMASQLFGAHPDKVSWSNFLNEPRVDGVGYGPFAENEALVDGGLVQLINKFAQGHEIKYETIIEKIEKSENGLLLSGPGFKEHFDLCVVSVPLGVLKKGDLEINYEIPASWRNAIRVLEMGHVQKINLDLNKKLLGKDKHGLYFTGKDFSIFGINEYHYSYRKIFSGFLTGKTAIDFEQRNEDQQKLFFKKFFRNFSENSEDKTIVTEVESSRWSLDRMSRGAYSYLGTEARGHEHQVFSQDLDPKIIMIGEHTHPTDPGTMHGAYWSGMRAAEQILGQS